MTCIRSTICVLFLVLTIPGMTQSLSLHCKGKNEGANIQTSFEPIDIQIELKTGQIYGFPGYKAPGCLESVGKNFSEIFDVTEDNFSTTCSNGFATSIINLNRYSGLLLIKTIFHKENEHWSGQYMCSQQKKKF